MQQTTRIELHPVIIRYCMADENGEPGKDVKVAILSGKDTFSGWGKTLAPEQKGAYADVSRCERCAAKSGAHAAAQQAGEGEAKVRFWMPEEKASAEGKIASEREGAGAPPPSSPVSKRCGCRRRHARPTPVPRRVARERARARPPSRPPRTR
jgi:hypothetical protein